MIDTIKELLRFGARPYRLTAPQNEEAEGLLILGDTGTGKSQMLHQLIARITERNPREAIICFDPVGEFVERHYNPRIDHIWNPLDARSLYWQPGFELSTSDQRANAPERLMVAESFFPIPEHLSPSTQFFPRAACAGFAQFLTQDLTPAQIVEILSNEELLDRCLANSEHAHLINKGAKAQRGGVLASMSEAGETFKLLPSAKECNNLGLSLRDWAGQREGTLFFTSTHRTRSALRRIEAAGLNIVITHLLSDTYRLRKRTCWVIIDEVHTLKYLPILKSVLVEGRKAGIKLVMATHNKSQFEEHYGTAAATMLAAPHSKAFFRTNEAESARWVSEMIGDEEKEERRLGVTASVQKHGRDSANYSSGIERRSVILKEQIMSLPNLNGYWKYEDAVVPFRIEPENFPPVARAFIPRQRRQSNGSTAQPMKASASETTKPLSTNNRQIEPADNTLSQQSAVKGNEINHHEQTFGRSLDDLDLNF